MANQTKIKDLSLYGNMDEIGKELASFSTMLKNLSRENDTVKFERDKALGRAEILEKRVAELEKQIASLNANLMATLSTTRTCTQML
ncbi:hypothetical protein V6N13_013986 [Hibiscus sabdariffa]|uniref:Uncharacterized protein n=1 Tax=Hibiscus sabdariffa TaxID=183260 RepID=A0ABR2RUN0_9ROSI